MKVKPLNPDRLHGGDVLLSPSESRRNREDEDDDDDDDDAREDDDVDAPDDDSLKDLRFLLLVGMTSSSKSLRQASCSVAL